MALNEGVPTFWSAPDEIYLLHFTEMKEKKSHLDKNSRPNFRIKTKIGI